MLGLRENYTQMVRQHFAFQTTVDGIRNAEKYLRDKGVTPTNFYGEESAELYVFAAITKSLFSLKTLTIILLNLLPCWRVNLDRS